MKLQRIEVSEKPQLTVVCHGDLDINGGREGEVAIKAYGREEDLQVQRDEEHLTITVHARCKVGCPRGTVLILQSVQGNARVRQIDGPIAIEVIQGDLVLKAVGPTNVTNANGDVRARSVHGDLQLTQVAGDLSVRGVQGRLSFDTVAGDLKASQLEGGLEGQVAGDASVTTDFTPDTDYRLTTGGDVAVRFPPQASATISVTADGPIHHAAEWSELAEDARTLSGKIGDGQANVAITAGGTVSLKSQSDSGAFMHHFALEDEGLDLELESMAEEIERNIQAHMARLNAHLEAKLSGIDHEAIRRRAERAAEKTRRKAERAAERARLKADRAQRRWERMGARAPRPPRSPASPHRPAEPISEQERMAVLRLVQEGKISAADAARLLEAMEG